MVMTAVDHGGSIGFACSGPDIESYLPSSCADVAGVPVVDPHAVVYADGTAWDGDAMRDTHDACCTVCCDGTACGENSPTTRSVWVVGKAECDGSHCEEWQATITDRAGRSGWGDVVGSGGVAEGTEPFPSWPARLDAVKCPGGTAYNNNGTPRS